MGKIKVLIVDDVPATLDNLKKLLSFEPDIEVVGCARSAQQAFEQLNEVDPNIVLMDINMPEIDGIKATQIITEQRPFLPVVIMSVQGERDYIRRAMQAGAREYLVKPFTGEELVASLRRTYESELRKAKSIEEDKGIVYDARGDRNAHVVSVISPKGGVGRTLLSINLAAAIAVSEKAKTCLVDLDLQFGDIAVLLNVDGRKNISDLIEVDEISSEIISKVLAPIYDVEVLCAPLSPELADLITVTHLRAIFKELSRMFEYIVIDTSANFGDPTLEAIDHSDQIILLTDLGLPAVKDVKLTLKVLGSLGYPLSNVLLVVNRSDAKASISIDNLEKMLGFKVAEQIPSNGNLVLDSYAKGIPFVLDNPNAEISRRMFALAKKIVSQGRHAESSKDFLHVKGK
jgi:pilus assembly protein CpaE